MINKFCHFTCIVFTTSMLFSFTGCKPKGKGKWVVVMESRDQNLSAANEQSIEKIYKKRLTTFGIDENDILMQPDGRRVTVEISEASNYPQDIITHIQKLLQANGNLSFWETYSVGEIGNKLPEALLQKTNPADTNADSSRYRRFLMMLVPNNNSDYRSPAIGFFKTKDTMNADGILDTIIHSDIFPRDLKFAWSIANEQGQCNLILLKYGYKGMARMDKPVLTDVRSVEDRQNGIPTLSISMDDASAEAWRRMTRDNIAKSIAIVFDGYVYAFPTVQNEINGGKSSITGNFTEAEIKELAAILKMKPLPCEMRIVQQNLVQ